MLVLGCLLILNSFVQALSSDSAKYNQPNKGHEWYVAWGYNLDYWSTSDIHVSQPSLGNNFTIHNVHASDDPGWTSGPFNHGLTGVQYNIRVGYFFNSSQTWAVELALDHTKYNTNLNQVAQVTGVINGQSIDASRVLDSQFFYYKLNNGANDLTLNFVRRIPLIVSMNAPPRLAALVKFGAGVMLPHATNTVLGQKNNVGPKQWGNYLGWNSGWWQVGGWTVGAQAGLRLTLYKHLYFEVTDKEAFVSLSQIPVYEGRADQTLWLNEVIFMLGLAF